MWSAEGGKAWLTLCLAERHLFPCHCSDGPNVKASLELMNKTKFDKAPGTRLKKVENILQRTLLFLPKTYCRLRKSK